MSSRVEEFTNNAELNELVSNGRWFVCYYAEWCGFCKQMSGDWEQLGNKVLENKLPVNIIKIEQQNIMDPTIKSFPTIKYYENGNVELYEGERNKDALYEFIKNKSICEKCNKVKQL